jgi:glycine/D-amino acid oxidase-like deaminating enzyme
VEAKAVTMSDQRGRAKEQAGGGREVLVIGAGIVGASIAYHLAARGAKVRVLDQAGPASGATGRSFAWINAHHSADRTYFQLRFCSLADYHRLDRELGGRLRIDWSGGLCWPVAGEDLEARAARFQDWGYAVEIVGGNQLAALEPRLKTPPARCLLSAQEGFLDPAAATRCLLEAAIERGATMLEGAAVSAIDGAGGRVTGVRTDAGVIAADTVVVAAGSGSAGLLAGLGRDLPMRDQPGLLVHTRPLAPLLRHLLWGDRIHMKQQADDRLVIGETFSSGEVETAPGALAAQMLEEASRALGGAALELERTTIGMRPIPADGLPVVGRVPGLSGLHLAVMHSGVTLAPLIGRLLAVEILDGREVGLLAPYRPERVLGASGADA